MKYIKYFNHYCYYNNNYNDDNYINYSNFNINNNFNKNYNNKSLINNKNINIFNKMIMTILLSFNFLLFLSFNSYSSSSLEWIKDDINIEDINKTKIFNFLRAIRRYAINNKSSLIIHNLAGNTYYEDNEYNDEYYLNNKNPNRLLFFDIIPNNTVTKLRLISTLTNISNLAKVGNTKEIISLLNNIEGDFEIEEEDNNQLPNIFKLDRKDSLISFFRRMDNDITKKSFSYLYNIYECINNNNDIIEASNYLEYLRNNDNHSIIYSLRSSILNLEDFGSGYRAFDIWLNELNTLLSTFDIETNKPRINELLNYVIESNVSFFKPKTNMLIGSFFYSSRTENEIDGALLCNGQHININKYPYFVNTYLKTKIINTISIQEWNKQKQEINNVGSFGYDEGSDFFIVPYVCPGTFLSPVITNYKIDNTEIKQGMFKKDQIVNIRGSAYPYWANHNWIKNQGALSIDKKIGTTFTRLKDGPDAWTTLDFDASRVVQTGDRVMPRTIFQNLYVIVSEE